ncbi:hypothetical protein BCR32DRAFT_287788 [Anaeromyces robustus]|uniref:Uncharacterized protein n=1 Tax=Anaeromyces robustus TaxID=1754192 RepID=A0A1Y1VQS8_9FUNG|nr:hypothetical protein BCR32DRAFT_287788 [Anaeromyces robustus]|eukprot:ORX63405.1 hypothetical protein BCR32DRAFT_287788 [Anaeromyces robustus]
MDNKNNIEICKKLKSLNLRYCFANITLIIICTLVGIFLNEYLIFTSILSILLNICMPLSIPSNIDLDPKYDTVFKSTLGVEKK